MVFIPVPHTCMVEIRYLSWAQRCENCLSFYKAGGFEGDDLEVITTHIANWWWNGLRTMQRNNVILREVYATDLTTKDGPTYTNSLWSGTTGSRTTGQTIPNNVSYVISFRTAGRGRSYRGRNFMLGLFTDYVNQNQVTATYRNTIIGYYQQLLPGGSRDPTPFRWVVASRYHDNQPRDPGIAIPIIAVVVANDDIDSMRKRLTGRGL